MKDQEWEIITETSKEPDEDPNSSKNPSLHDQALEITKKLREKYPQFDINGNQNI